MHFAKYLLTDACNKGFKILILYTGIVEWSEIKLDFPDGLLVYIIYLEKEKEKVDVILFSSTHGIFWNVQCTGGDYGHKLAYWFFLLHRKPDP